MKILILCDLGKAELIQGEVLPRVGDRIDMFYEPCPTVSMVLLFPSKERLAAIHCEEEGVDAIVTVQ